MIVKVKRIDSSIPLPKYEKDAAGFDFYCRETIKIHPKQIVAIPSNVVIQIPKGYVLLVIPRSSTPKRKGLVMPNSVGVIDPFFSGDNDEIKLIFQNITDTPTVVRKGEKVAQGILVKCELVDFHELQKLRKTKRKSFNYNVNTK